MIFELHENQTGQQQHSQSSSWFQAVSFHNTVLYTHTLTHTHTHTPTRTGLLHSAALQLTASLGVVFLSSWLAEIKQVAMSLSLLRVYLSHRWWSLTLFGAELQWPAPNPHFPFVSPPTRATNHQHLVVRALSTRQPVRDCRRADSGVQPRRLSGALRCLLSASPATRKSRLWRHTMWKGGRFKKEKNASKNNKSQL